MMRTRLQTKYLGGNKMALGWAEY